MRMLVLFTLVLMFLGVAVAVDSHGFSEDAGDSKKSDELPWYIMAPVISFPIVLILLVAGKGSFFGRGAPKNEYRPGERGFAGYAKLCYGLNPRGWSKKRHPPKSKADEE